MTSEQQASDQVRIDTLALVELVGRLGTKQVVTLLGDACDELAYEVIGRDHAAGTAYYGEADALRKTVWAIEGK